MKNNIIFWIIVFAGTIILNSCTARKSEVAKKEETAKTDFSGFFRNSGNAQEFLKTDLNLKRYGFTKIDDQNKKSTIKKTFKPVDPKLPASVTDESGKKYNLNNASYTEENTVEENNKKTENSRNSEKSEKSELEKKSNYIQRLETKIKEIKRLSEKNKKTENEGFSFSNYLLLLLPIGLMFVAWKVYKNLNPIA